MCQLLGLSSSDPIRLSFSWESFVQQGSAAQGNPDGWGVAYFDGADVALLREPSPAAQSPMVRFLNSHAPRSNLIISHVRRATHGDRNLANTQPFQRVLGGRAHVFAHNGFVPPDEQHDTSSWLRTRHRPVVSPRLSVSITVILRRFCSSRSGSSTPMHP